MFDGLISNIMENAKIVSAGDEGDYLLDGLLYCGKCDTPKQQKVPHEISMRIFGEQRTYFCQCKCQAEAYKKKQEEEKQKELRKKIQGFRQVGFPESNMQAWTFENADGTNAENIKAMQEYVSGFDGYRKKGKGLLLFGNVGSGKTYAAACVANALIDNGYPVLMTNFDRIANTVMEQYEGKQRYMDSLNGFSLLVLDDLGVERKTEYMQEIVYSIIDARCRAGLPLIVTTNLTWKQITDPKEIAYQRIYSRLLKMCIPIKFDGKDKRLEQFKNQFTEDRQKLGF